MVVGVWLRCAMGLYSSPYNVIQGALVAKRFVLGDPDNSDNAFQWSFVTENLPCSPSYDASNPSSKNGVRTALRLQRSHNTLMI